ncbi:hypothetical protein RIF29_12124 [Crotalaria pallida]|uniref:RRM domain-containing protein n=1 Tax=Crotalaria pallida TaxID=3830 RepID=A0AAN9IN43_CROPI
MLKVPLKHRCSLTSTLQLPLKRREKKHAELLALPGYGYEVVFDNLTFSLSEDFLGRKCEPLGIVRQVQIIEDKDTGERKGYVVFTSKEASLKAIKFLNEVVRYHVPPDGYGPLVVIDRPLSGRGPSRRSGDPHFHFRFGHGGAAGPAVGGVVAAAIDAFIMLASMIAVRTMNDIADIVSHPAQIRFMMEQMTPEDFYTPLGYFMLWL